MIALETRNLVRRFGGVTAVDDLRLQVRAGEIRCLIGPNGAGKSTVLAMLAGHLRPTAGAILFANRDISALPAYWRARHGIGVKFQVPSIFPALSVRQNLKIAKQRRLTGPELGISVDATLRTLKLAHRADDLAQELSHGEKQWLELGLALAVSPTLLLLDEPTAGMTPAETAATGELLKSLNSDGMTIVAVEHDMAFVRQIAHSVTVLNLGRHFAEGSVDQILESSAVLDLYLGRQNGEQPGA